MVALAVAAALLLGWLYVSGAREHARVRNLEKSRGDQTPYMVMALEAYANRHGQDPPFVHSRNRMPLYPWLQSFAWDPAISHWEYFYRGREWNIRGSLLLLAILGTCFWRATRPLVALVLLLVVAFGYFIYKAGYFQPELLYYTLFFLAFLSACHLLQAADARRRLAIAAITGTLAALAHLTKAAMQPFVLLLALVYTAQAVHDVGRGAGALEARLARLAWRALAAAVFAACLFGVLYPYISTSRRVFGEYFYNVNTSHYLWYDDWHDAIRGTRSHDDERRMPRLPPGERPSARKYLREHSAAQIAARLRTGFLDMWEVSYRYYGYVPSVSIYLLLLIAVLATRARAVREALRGRGFVATFVILYAGTYLATVAFYHPISGTGTARFLQAHLAPLLFSAGWLFSRLEVWSTRWQIGRLAITPARVHVVVLAVIAFDLAFLLWPRLLRTYGGF